MKEKTHISVLQQEAIDALAIKNSSTIVDATLGASGHAQIIISALGRNGTFVGIDADKEAIDKGKEILKGAKCKTHLIENNFRNIRSILDLLHIEKVDGILADLGWRMEQFSGNGKGFSFQIDEPLLMTFGKPEDYPFVARDILNEWDENDIKNVLKGYGEERFSGRIARHVVEARVKKPFVTTFDLVSVIKEAVPVFYTRGRIHFATRCFQALRIAVNDEFSALETFIKEAVLCLRNEGRLAIVTFHSTEDRIVKHLFKALASEGEGVICTKKPIVPTRQEVTENPRSRSAKLRIFQKNEKT
jgi:16S rRNA (cytosine1402-N4)-methyltransferase